MQSKKHELLENLLFAGCFVSDSQSTAPLLRQTAKPKEVELLDYQPHIHSGLSVCALRHCRPEPSRREPR